MKKAATKNFERISQAHSLMHNPELTESAPVLRPLEKNTFEDLLNVAESAQKSLPNLIYLGSKEEIKNRSSKMPQVRVTQPLTGRLVAFDRSSLLSAYFKKMYLQAAQPEFFYEDKVPALNLPSGKFPKIDVFAIPTIKNEKFPSAVFTYCSPSGKNVEMLWQPKTGESLQRALMDNQSYDKREAAIFLDYGEHLFTFKTGNLVCPPINYSQRLRFQKTGIFAFYESKKPELLVLLSNPTKNAILVLVKGKKEWLKDSYWMLPPLSRKCIALNFLPENPALGTSEAEVQIECLSGRVFTKVNSFNLSIETKVNRAFPTFRCKLAKASARYESKPDARLIINISLQGTGSLTGSLLIPQIGAHANFRTEDTATNSDFEYSFPIPSEKFILCGNTLKVILVTDSYYANMRFQEKSVAFQKVYLKKSLPALFFNDMLPGSERTLPLVVRRTDGKSFHLKTSVPPGCEKYLKVFRRDSSALIFHFDTSNLRPGTKINEIIGLIDADSGLRDRIKIIANVVNA